MSRSPTLRRGAPALLAALSLVLASASCKTAARSEEISPGEVKIERRHTGSVQVSAECPREGLFNGPRIPPRRLIEATESAILESALFEGIGEDAEPDYHLHARVETIEEEDYSLDMTAEVRIEWSLRPAGGGDPLWFSSIKTSHKVSPYDSRDMKERLLLALEGATRKNIKKAVQRLAGIELDPAPPHVEGDSSSTGESSSEGDQRPDGETAPGGASTES